MAPALVASSGVFKTRLTMKDTYPEKHPRWWFDNYLPDPYRSQAIENHNNDPEPRSEFENSLASAIHGGFVWNDTPQSHNYWADLRARAKSGEFNTPLP